MDADAGGEHTLSRSAPSPLFFVVGIVIQDHLSRSASGAVFSAGGCGLGWCRLQEVTAALFGWRKVPIAEPIANIAACYYHNLAIGARSRRVYSWG